MNNHKLSANFGACKGEACTSSVFDTSACLTNGEEAEQTKDLNNAGCIVADDGSTGDCEEGNKSVPAEALFYVLPYMSLTDVLNMEQICRAFRDWIRNDPLLWRIIHIELPSSRKLTDGTLLQLASRARGQLECLSLVNCLGISEGAVEQVVLSNPRLSKLFLPGCSGLSIESIMRMVKACTEHKAPDAPGLKQLKLRNNYGVTKEHLDSLLALLTGEEEDALSGSRKPQFYNGVFSLNYDRPIDLEVCPKCSCVRAVYDCNRDTCGEECRACIFCISRCWECGGCVHNDDQEEPSSLDSLCSVCWFILPKCSECNHPERGHADHFAGGVEKTFVCSKCKSREFLDYVAHTC